MSAPSPEPKIVRKAGEGYDRPNADQELPIDINYQKLSEWLVSRQKLPSDWHKRVQAIQSKITEAIQGLPAGLLAQLPGGAEAAVDYFRAVQIRDKLAETADRTLFGGLSGQAGIWDKIVKAYENGGVFVGEAAQTMVQNVDYEIPYLRKQMAKCNQQMADADRRHAEYTRSAATCASNYKKECAKLGISGSAIAQELRQLSQQLPGMLLNLVQELRSPDLDQAIAYYQHFTQYAHGSEAGKPPAAAAAAEVSGEQQQELPQVLHVLMEIRERRTAPYSADAANNAAAGSSSAPGSNRGGLELPAAAVQPGTTDPVGIDWGAELGDDSGNATATDAGDAVARGISWDLGDLDMSAAAGEEDSAAAGGGISWDVEVEQPEAADTAAAVADGGPTLDWDIDLSGIGVEGAGESTTTATAAGIDWGVDVGYDGVPHAAVEGTSTGAATAVGSSSSGDAAADRLQHDSDYRSQLLDDLQELRAFLVSRKSGLAGSSSSSDLLRALAPDVVASTDAGDVKLMLSRVEHLLAALNDDKLRQLLMISSSSRYVERLQSSLQRKAGQEGKMLAAAAETQARKHESRATLVSLQPKVAEIVAHTRSIKQAVEAALSKQFNGRRVNVLGEINNALAVAV